MADPKFSFRFEGIDALRRAFADLPRALGAEASALALTHAQAAESVIRPVYDAHRRTGNLGRGLRVTTMVVGPYARAAIIRSRAPHAALFEDGTAVRKTRQGWNRGRSPAHPTFRAPVARESALFDQGLADLLRRVGLTVER